MTAMSDDEEVEWVDASSRQEAPKRFELFPSRSQGQLLSAVKGDADEKDSERNDELDCLLDSIAVAKERKNRPSKPRAPTFEPTTDARELNPYWKNGGAGLPDDNPAKLAAPAQTANVGDAGAAWFRRALQRCEQQAADEGRSLEDVAAERWGSLERLRALVGDAERSSGSSQRRAASNRREGTQYSKDGSSNSSKNSSDSHYREQNDRSYRRRELDARSFQRPDDSRHVERQGDYRDRERDRNRDHYRDNDRSHDPDRNRDHKRERESDRAASSNSYDKSASRSNEPSHRGGAEIEQKRSNDGGSQLARASDAHSMPKVDTAVVNQPAAQQAPASNSQITEVDLNKLNARLLRAEMSGNTQLAATIRAQIEAAKQRTSQAVANSVPASAAQSSSNVPEVDAQVNPPTRKWREERDRLNVELKQMMRQERCLTAAANEQLFSAQQGATRDADDEYDQLFAVPGTSRSQPQPPVGAKKQKVDTATVKKFKFTPESVKKLVDADSIRSFKREQNEMARCNLCVEKATRHLIVSQGTHAYLCVSSQDDVTENQCVILPNEHIDSLLKCVNEPELISQLGAYRRAVRSMYTNARCECLFLEHSVSGQHASIACVPLDSSSDNDAEMYFRKAILEIGSEWAQNRKLVPFGADPELTGSSIRRALPRALAYFAVYFADGHGYAHVIDDAKTFRPDFGFEVLAGLFELDALQLRAKRNKKISFEEQAAKSMRFAKAFSRFDPLRVESSSNSVA